MGGAGGSMGGAGGVGGSMGGAGGVGGSIGGSGGVGGSMGGAGGMGTGGMGGGTATLLIPNVSNDSVGMFDPQTGAYLGDFLPASTPELSTPICAMQGPNGNIFVSDQIADAVFQYDTTGTLIGAFADASDGLNNIRGIDFFGTDLYVTDSGSNRIAVFDSMGAALADFTTSVDAFDILFLNDGRAMLTEIDTDDVRLYQAGGGSFTSLISTDFPEQVQAASNGNYLFAALTADEVVEFTEQGVFVRSVTVNFGRGVHELTTGNWLVASGDGLQVIDPVNATVVTTVDAGTGWRFIELVMLP
jgi:hypothetical protein